MQERLTIMNQPATIQQRPPITDAALPDRPTVKEVARWLRKSPNCIYMWASCGKIPCVQVGRSYIFDKAALLEWARPVEVQ